jgi:hypothetical protein
MTSTARPTLIGLTGKMGAGKDEVYSRLRFVFGEHIYRRASFADPLKKSVAALFDVSPEVLDAWKNEPQMRVSVLDLKGNGRDLGRSFSVREILQRYGTEAHREIFGEDFWVEVAMQELDRQRGKDAMMRVGPYTYVFTDVRFENEARAIEAAGGVIVRVLGINDDTGDHASEAGVPDSFIDFEIDNTFRPDRDPELLMQAMDNGSDEIVKEAQGAARAHLDDEIAKLHAALSEAPVISS